MHITLYMRPNCTLCEEARQLLHIIQHDVPFTLDEVNIEEHDALHEQWMLLIPAVVHEGQVLQHSSIDYITIEGALQVISTKLRQ